MRRLHIDYPVLITAGLALLLIAYVFAGGMRRPSDPQVRCSSPQALDQVKRELFRRAAIIRGTNETDFPEVANYAVVRTESRVVRKRAKEGVNCSASIVLDLPPGLQVIGGRRSLAANIRYAVAGASDASAQLRGLENADAIVQPLATISQIGGQTGAALVPMSGANQAVPPEGSDASLPTSEPRVPPPVRPTPPRAAAAPEREARPTVKPTPERTAARQAPTPRRAPAAATTQRKTAAVSTQAKPRPPATPKQTPVASAPVAQQATRPSFNCRYAKTRGELAVCRNPSLANLDRQMSARFHGAMSGASPGARVILQRSRNSFLKSRDACGSEACIAEAYRVRIAEIDAITSRF